MYEVTLVFPRDKTKLEIEFGKVLGQIANEMLTRGEKEELIRRLESKEK